MQDLVRFHMDSFGAASALAPVDARSPPALLPVDVRTLPPSLFASVPDIERARAVIKRTRMIHLPIWQPDVGLARLFKEHNAVMVVGLADLLPLPPHDLGKRLARTSHMVKMVLHFGGRVRLASMARNENERRNALELACIGERLGLSPAQVMDGLKDVREG